MITFELRNNDLFWCNGVAHEIHAGLTIVHSFFYCVRCAMAVSTNKTGATSAWLSAVFLLALFSHHVGVLAVKSLNKVLVDLPSQGSEKLKELERIRQGKPVSGRVELQETRLLEFGVPMVDDEFPSVLLTLEVENALGDADLFCAPWIWLRSMSRFPGPQFYVWKSVHSQAIDAVFLSSQHSQFNRSRVVIDDGTGTNTNVEVAAFACAVYGESRTVSEFEVRLDLVAETIELVAEEQEVMKNIYDKCCGEEGTCFPWVPNKGSSVEGNVTDDAKGVDFDFCNRIGNICTTGGMLKVLNMNSYNMSCDFPVNEFSKLKALEILDLKRNQLKGDAGEIVAGLSGLKKLHLFNAEGNLMSGSLSSTPNACSLFEQQLQFFNVRFNDIGGRLPGCLLSSATLLELHVAHNKIFGEVPDTVPVDANLEAVTLSHNMFRGRFPESFGNAKSLRYFTAYNNTLSGPIPSSLGTLESLERLDLGFNSFVSFPESWADTEWDPPAMLEVLSIPSNLLKGSFPSAFGKAINLKVLDISNNMLGGPVDVQKDAFSRIEVFNISRNQFSGPIPKALEGMPMFKPTPLAITYSLVFDVSHNQLTGEIPSFFYESSTSGIGFGRVNLDNNTLTCAEPSQLQYITYLNCEPDPTIALKNQAPQDSDQSPSSPSPSSSSGNKMASVGIGLGIAVAFIAVVVAGVVIAVRRNKAKSAARSGFAEEADVEIGAMKIDDGDRILPQQVQRS